MKLNSEFVIKAVVISLFTIMASAMFISFYFSKKMYTACLATKGQTPESCRQELKDFKERAKQ